MTSVIKLCEEDIHWTIVGDNGSKQELEKVAVQAMQATKKEVAVRMVEVQEHWPEASHISNGYLGQQWVKMTAHKVMGDDLYWNWDSDVIAVKPFSSQSFTGKSGRPIYWFSQFNTMLNGPDRGAHEGRMKMMKEILGLPEISFEWMRCMPIPMFGQILKNAEARNKEWSKAFHMMASGDMRMSEFNLMGQFSQMFYPDAFEWRNAESHGPSWGGGWDQGGNCFQANAITSQSWSYGGIPAHLEKFVLGL